MEHVAYKGGGPAMTDALGGQIHGVLVNIAGPLQYRSTEVAARHRSHRRGTRKAAARRRHRARAGREHGLAQLVRRRCAGEDSARRRRSLASGSAEAAQSADLKERLDTLAVEP